MYFSDSSGDDFKIAKKNAVAIITLDYFDKIEEADGTLYLLKLTTAKYIMPAFLKHFYCFLNTTKSQSYHLKNINLLSQPIVIHAG